MLVVSHTTGGGGGVRASDVTHYFLTSTKLLFLMQNYGSKRFSRVQNGVLAGRVAVSASDIIERCPHQIAVFSRSSSW